MSKFLTFQRLVVFSLSIAMVEVPFALNANNATAGMISTSNSVAFLMEGQTRQKVLAYLDRPEVQRELIKNGVAPKEASMRVASLSGVELRQISNQIDQAQFGGEVIVIGLGTILVVVLILLLIGRI